jgi:hypothetical protein
LLKVSKEDISQVLDNLIAWNCHFM